MYSPRLHYRDYFYLTSHVTPSLPPWAFARAASYEPNGRITMGLHHGTITMGPLKAFIKIDYHSNYLPLVPPYNPSVI